MDAVRLGDGGSVDFRVSELPGGSWEVRRASGDRPPEVLQSLESALVRARQLARLRGVGTILVSAADGTVLLADTIT